VSADKPFNWSLNHFLIFTTIQRIVNQGRWGQNQFGGQAKIFPKVFHWLVKYHGLTICGAIDTFQISRKKV